MRSLRLRTREEADASPGIGRAALFGWSSLHSPIRLFAAGTLIYEFNSWFVFFHRGEYVDLMVRSTFSCAGADIVSSPFGASQDACQGLAGFLPLFQLYRNNIGDALASVAVIAVLFVAATWFWRAKLKMLWRRGRKDVEAQQAHGGARLASETETLRIAASGTGRRSSVHDQEF